MQSDSLKMHRLCWRAQTGFHRPLKHANHPCTNADVSELVDARDLKSLDGNVVWVRVPPPAPPDRPHAVVPHPSTPCPQSAQSAPPPPSPSTRLSTANPARHWCCCCTAFRSR